MNEYEKQQASLWYNPNSTEIKNLQEKSRGLNLKFNNEVSSTKRQAIMKEWFAKIGKNCYIEPQVFCDFGSHLILGDNVYFNTNCVILDSAKIEIGNNVLIGSNVQLCTPTHPINPLDRQKPENEKALPIKIGNNCWIGSSVTITGGVTIGENVVIGAGCTINRNIESNVLVRYSKNNITTETIH